MAFSSPLRRYILQHGPRASKQRCFNQSHSSHLNSHIEATTLDDLAHSSSFKDYCLPSMDANRPSEATSKLNKVNESGEKVNQRKSAGDSNSSVQKQNIFHFYRSAKPEQTPLPPQLHVTEETEKQPLRPSEVCEGQSLPARQCIETTIWTVAMTEKASLERLERKSPAWPFYPSTPNRGPVDLYVSHFNPTTEPQIRQSIRPELLFETFGDKQPKIDFSEAFLKRGYYDAEIKSWVTGFQRSEQQVCEDTYFFGLRPDTSLPKPRFDPAYQADLITKLQVKKAEKRAVPIPDKVEPQARRDKDNRLAQDQRKYEAICTRLPGREEPYIIEQKLKEAQQKVTVPTANRLMTSEETKPVSRAEHKPLVVGLTKPQPDSKSTMASSEQAAALNKEIDANIRNNTSAAAPSEDNPTAPSSQKPKKEKAPKQPKQPKGGAAAPAPTSPALIDLRVGHILRAIAHPNADSLYVSTIAMGDAEGTEHTQVDEETGKVVRTVCSGLNGLVPLAEMQDRKVIVVANLKPVNMRSIKSAAMVLAASPKVEEGADPHAADRVVELVSPPLGAEAGDKVFFDGWPYGEGKGPEKQLNPKKKQWEAIQPGFFTGDDLTVGFDAGRCEEVDGEAKGDLIVEGKGACVVKTLKGAVVR